MLVVVYAVCGTAVVGHLGCVSSTVCVYLVARQSFDQPAKWHQLIVEVDEHQPVLAAPCCFHAQSLPSRALNLCMWPCARQDAA